MIRPLYRWKSFWLGVLVLVFLGWAWRESLHHQTSLTINNVYDGSVAIPQGMWHSDSRVTFRMVRQVGAKRGVVTGRGEFSLLRMVNTPDNDPPLIHWKSLGISRTTKGAMLADELIELPHWFLILLFLVPWSGWHAWRWRAMNRETHIAEA